MTRVAAFAMFYLLIPAACTHGPSSRPVTTEQRAANQLSLKEAKRQPPASAVVVPQAATTAEPSPDVDDPFARLKIVIPREKLPPLRSVRLRDEREAKDRSRSGSIVVRVRTSPKGARVHYGGKLLGTTPFSLKARRGSTPLDVVIRAKGYMTLRTRLRRKISRDYFFKLTPAKIR